LDTSFRDFFDRYGPTLALILTIVVLVVLMPSNSHGGGDTGIDTSAVDSGATGQTVTGANGSATAVTPGTPAAGGGTATGTGGTGTAAAGATQGSGGQTLVKGETGTYKCRPDGRQSGISGYMPPCHQFDGDNGGATGAKGVTATQIKVAYYVPEPNAATQAALKAAGAGDTQEDIDRSVEVFRRYYNDHYQTYGREVTLTKINASGPASDDVAMKADAHKIAEAGFFSVLIAGLTSGSSTFDSTVAQLGVMCVYCSASVAQSFYDRTTGYIWGALPTAREYYETIGEYWGLRLAGKKAEFAGPGPEGTPATPSPTDLRNKKRKFGLIWVNANMGTVDPGWQEERDNFINNILPKWGMSKNDIVDSSYNYDLTQGPTTAQTIISKMNSAGVTTIAMFAEPLTPVFFTREATKENYYPEWFQTGVGLMDTTFFGRTYDRDQWEHSFGISSLWVFWQNLQVSDGWREYHHTCDQAKVTCADKSETVGVNTTRGAFITLWTGIEMAGEHLTVDTFAKGQYAYPPTGGTPAAPLFHFTKTSPNILKDWVEVWWDPNRTGKDEVNQTNAGVLMKAQNGKRYLSGQNQWPRANPYVFGQDPHPIYTSDAFYTGDNVIQHEQDGHHHPPEEKCLSCGGPWPD
jgi:hypothetical protein